MSDHTVLRRMALSLGAPLLIGLAVFGCTDEPLGPPGFDDDLSVVLENDPSNGLPIHILGPGESFSPSNRLEPGENRTIVVRIDQNDTPGFQAGRNGNVLSGVACEHVRDSGGSGFVVWIDGQLECQNSLRVVSRF